MGLGNHRQSLGKSHFVKALSLPASPWDWEALLGPPSTIYLVENKRTSSSTQWKWIKRVQSEFLKDHSYMILPFLYSLADKPTLSLWGYAVSALLLSALSFPFSFPSISLPLHNSAYWTAQQCEAVLSKYQGTRWYVEKQFYFQTVPSPSLTPWVPLYPLAIYSNPVALGGGLLTSDISWKY